MGLIYKITSPTSKIYVGKTYDLRKRINCHKCCVRKGSNIILHNSIRKYGWDAHVLEIIEEVDDSLLNEREMFWITELKTYCYENKMGLNMTKGGEGQRSTWMHKIEQRKKQSERFTKEGNPFFGKKHTNETIKFLSENAVIRNKKNGTKIPEWGAEKGRNIVRKKVICYDFFGKLLSEHESVTSAGKDLGLNPSSISAVCKGNRNHTGGFCFEYKDIFEKPKESAKAG
jgi:group I intron endonuclease